MNTAAWGTNIMDVASSVIGKLKTNQDELINTAANGLRKSEKWNQVNAKSGLTSILRDEELEEDAINNILSGMNGSNIDEMVDSVSANVQKEVGGNIDSLLKDVKKKAKANASGFTDKEVLTMTGNGGPIKSKILYPEAYFTNPDKSIAATRRNVAVGGVAAAGIGGRFLSGGTLTEDSYGRKNIVGVPFI